jgi:hypothetical protein
MAFSLIFFFFSLGLMFEPRRQIWQTRRDQHERRRQKAGVLHEPTKDDTTISPRNFFLNSEIQGPA